MKTLKHTNNIQEIPMSKLSTHYESYKFIQPKSESAAFNSIQKLGQWKVSANYWISNSR